MSINRGDGKWGKPAIVLARHGRPALDHTPVVDWRGYGKWWSAYDESGLAPGEKPPKALLEVARDAHAVLASPLQRSLETARAVAQGREVVTDPVFLEAALPPPPIPGLLLKPRQWSVLSRIAWYYGYSGGMESRKEAEARAERAVDRVLEDLAGEPLDQRVVLVCAHGWFNRMMRPVLHRRGWRCVYDGRDGYWSFRRYELAPGVEPVTLRSGCAAAEATGAPHHSGDRSRPATRSALASSSSAACVT